MSFDVASADPASALLALMLESRGVQSSTARQEIHNAYDLLEDARRQVREAMARAAEAQEDAGFWDDLGNILGGDVACIAQLVATAALVAATGGTGAVAVLALVASGMSIGADVGARLGLDPKVCLLLGTGAALAGVATGRLDTTAGLWANVAKGAQVAHGAATAGAGASEIVQGKYEGDALAARADAVGGRGLENDALFRFDRALEALGQAARDIQRGQAAASAAVKAEGDGRLTLVAGMGGA